MNPFILLLPTLLVVVAVVYGIFRALSRVWLEHKVKMALLEKLESHPELIPSFQELQSLVNSVSAGHAPQRQDFTMTGIILALIGLGCVIWARSFGMGRLSVGVYFGGLVCVCLGSVLALIGWFIRNMTRGKV